jgi:hypothetical protein
VGQRVRWTLQCLQLTCTLYFTKYVTRGRDLHTMGELRNSLSCHFKTYNIIPKDCWLYAILFELLLFIMLTCLIVFVVFSVPSVKYGNVVFNLAWKIANLSILRESFYKFYVMLKFYLHLTPSVWTLLACHVNGINICCHDSCNCPE